jgi:IclR family transcriptional regulator, KDG regulon repressor
MEQENMKSLAKTFSILDLYLHGKDELSVTEISNTLGLNKATVSRILSKLVKHGYLRQMGKRGKFSLGPIFLEFSGIVKRQLKLRDVAIPYLYELNRLVKESVIIAVWDKREAIITETFHETNYTQSPLKVVPDEGTSLPLYCTCLGKIILAAMSKNKIDEYFRNNALERRTPNTITSISEIENQLLNSKKEDVAFDDEEYAIGVRGMATGIRNDRGEIVGSLGIVAPAVRLSHAGMSELLPALKQYANEISKQLGYQGKKGSPVIQSNKK